jgi:hypothetical protein
LQLNYFFGLGKSYVLSKHFRFVVHIRAFAG